MWNIFRAWKSIIVISLLALPVELSAADFAFPSPLTISTNYVQTSGAFTPDYLDDEIRPVQKPRLVKPLPLATLTFKPSVVRRKQSIEDFLNKVRSISPQSEDILRKQFAESDIFVKLAAAIAPNGLSVNNIADAYAVYWVSIWEASRGLIRPSNTTELQAVKAQVAEIMRTSPEYAAMTSTDKQAFSESLYLSSMAFSSSLDTLKDDPKQLASYAAEVNRQATAVGFALDAVTLTDKGFVLATVKRAKR
jgi:hypothetical protein